MTAKYIKSPNERKHTSSPKFGANPDNYHYEEVAGFTRKIRNNDLASCDVIIDLVKKEVIKCRVNAKKGGFTDTSYDTIYKYFESNYADAMRAVMAFAEPKIAPKTEFIDAKSIDSSVVKA